MHAETAYVSVLMTFNSVRCFAVEDEESTIEEQEATEVPADQKAELAELTKEGAFCAFFLVIVFLLLYWSL